MPHSGDSEVNVGATKAVCHRTDSHLLKSRRHHFGFAVLPNKIMAPVQQGTLAIYADLKHFHMSWLQHPRFILVLLRSGAGPVPHSLCFKRSSVLKDSILKWRHTVKSAGWKKKKNQQTFQSHRNKMKDTCFAST